jgi:hypothetical protein
MTDAATAAVLPKPNRAWLFTLAAGLLLVLIALVVVALVIADKPHFGWLVGSAFLPAITSGVMVGALMMFVAALRLPERKTWRRIILIAWSVIAVTSPAFGIMFLLPWGVMVVTLPLVIWILAAMFRAA